LLAAAAMNTTICCSWFADSDKRRELLLYLVVTVQLLLLRFVSAALRFWFNGFSWLLLCNFCLLRFSVLQTCLKDSSLLSDTST